MKPGDIVKFWDSEGGEGYVVGLIVEIQEILSHVRYDGEIRVASVIYKNRIQTVPLSQNRVEEITPQG